MALRTLKSILTPDDVLSEHVHSLTIASADPLAAAVVPLFDNLIADWKVKEAQRIQLVIAAARAAASAYYLDNKLDAFVAQLVNVLSRIDSDRSSALWFIFFRGVAPSIFTRPILSGQLTKMRLWVKSLADSPHAELKALVPVLEPLIAAGTEAETAVAHTKQDLLAWKSVGAWPEHIATSNAARTDAYGQLLDIPHAHPELKLPADYAEMFFLHDTSRRGADKPKTSKELRAELTALDKDREALAAAIEEAEGREQAEARDEAELEAKRQELEAIERQDKANADRRKQLEAEMAKGKKKDK